ncbi:hypothetical protein LTR27_001823 [Elasticomyces elasticus]|nr:hypothetical protein LTR27_001823 [Elasticomyces elasticus]
MTQTSTQTVSTRLNFSLPPSEGGCVTLSNNNSSTFKIRWDNRSVEIQDARSREHEFSLNKQGFEFHHAPIPSLDFEDEEAVRSSYYKDVEKLALKLTGADRAHAVGHVKRTTYTGDVTADKAIAPAPATMVHVDYSYDGAWERFDKQENRGGVEIPNWDMLKQNHWAALSIWRPLRTITRDALACGDKTTVPDDQLREIRITHQNGAEHGMFHLAYDPKQAFWYKSRMEPDEVIAIKLFDSKQDGRARGTPHTGFQTEQDEGPPRYSIETRVLVFWKNESLE